ncbi:hypothetical protein GEMRC1_007605 [Eukaryota sp. GEM-RC1]
MSGESVVKRGFVRYLVLVIDCSLSCLDNDFKPNRLSVCKTGLTSFVPQFLNDNSLSQIAIINCKDGKAHKSCTFLSESKSILSSINSLEVGSGQFSLQNCLKLASHMFLSVPEYASREVLFLTSTLSSIDPDNVFDAVATIKSMLIRTFFISLSASIYLFEKTASETNGWIKVLLDQNSIAPTLSLLLPPPPSLYEASLMIEMGFPKKKEPALVHLDVTSTPVMAEFECPKCLSLVDSLPSRCPVCSLHLASSFNLIQASHHLYPLPNASVVDVTGQECVGCTGDVDVCYECDHCKKVFCSECRMFMKEVLLTVQDV